MERQQVRERKAGYDPQSFMSFFEKIHAKQKQKPALCLRSLPRIPQWKVASKTQKQIDTKLRSRPQYVVTKLNLTRSGRVWLCSKTGGESRTPRRETNFATI